MSQKNDNHKTQNINIKNESWNDQKNRMDDMLAKLKNEIQDVKALDKDLTRQFINLGGIINKIKTEQLDEDVYYEDLIEVDENENETRTADDKTEGDTKL